MPNKMISTPSMKEGAVSIVKHLFKHGYTAYWAGGCVRDILMERSPKDYDIATDASSTAVESLFENTRIIGKAFGVTQVMLNNIPYEVATFRKESGYQNGRHPTHIESCLPEEDANRRDFTINGIFFDPLQNKIIDFVNGEKDIKKKCLRVIGQPHIRFKEDHLRLLRAIRFSSILGFKIEEKTGKAIQQFAPLVNKVSAERIREELSRLFTESCRAGDALYMLYQHGLLQQIIPEAIEMIGQQQPPQFHPEGDVFEHTVIMMNKMENPSVSLAFSALLHDIGKPRTATDGVDKKGEPRIRFNNHARVGAEMAEKILDRLKFPNTQKKEIVHCVANHMRFIDVHRMRKNTLRKLVGGPYFETELELHRLDCISSHGKMENWEFLQQFKAEFESEPVLPSPIISGYDLLKLGIDEGPEIGKYKKRVYDKQLNNPELTKEELIKWISKDM